MSTYTEKHREYYLKNRERINADRKLREPLWIKTPRGQYSVQKRKAKQRGIPWELTFEQWWKIWQASGRWGQRGDSGDAFCMCRYGDTGPYSKENVRIDTCRNNVKENYLLLGVTNGRINSRSV